MNVHFYLRCLDLRCGNGVGHRPHGHPRSVLYCNGEAITCFHSDVKETNEGSGIFAIVINGDALFQIADGIGNNDRQFGISQMARCRHRIAIAISEVDCTDDVEQF